MGTACGARAPGTPATGSKCWKVTYTTPTGDAGSAGFASVHWQAHVQPMGGGTYYNNFGIAAGVVPPAGANELSFWAKGAAGGESVTFGIGSSGDMPCTDSEISSNNVSLTTTWTKYTIPFSSPTYTGGQVDGFSWDVAGTAGASVTFYVDNVVWDVGDGGL